MAQCIAKTKEGKPCQLSALKGQKYCHLHRKIFNWRRLLGLGSLLLVILGLIGNITSILDYLSITPRLQSFSLEPTSSSAFPSTSIPENLATATILDASSPIPIQQSPVTNPTPTQIPSLQLITIENAISLQIIANILYSTDLLPSGGMALSEHDGGLLVLGFTDGHVGLWSLETQNEIPFAAPHQTLITDLQFSPTNPDILVSASRDTSMKLWRINKTDVQPDKDENNKNAIRRLGNDVFVNAAAFSPDGRTLAVGLTGNQLALFSMNTYNFSSPQLVYPDVDNENPENTNPDSVVNDLAFSPEGSLLAIASSDWSIYFWKFNESDNSLVHKTNITIKDSARRLAFSRLELNLLAIGSVDGRIIVYDLDDLKEPVFVFKFPVGETQDISWSPRGDILVVCSDKGPIYILRPSKNESVKFPNTFRKSYGCTFSPDGKMIVISTEKGLYLLGIPVNK